MVGRCPLCEKGSRKEEPSKEPNTIDMLEDIAGALQELDSETDRAAAILGTVCVDECLAGLVGAPLIDDSKARRFRPEGLKYQVPPPMVTSLILSPLFVGTHRCGPGADDCVESVNVLAGPVAAYITEGAR
jgi:hypothetical protein